jgi:hypothetical protein
LGDAEISIGAVADSNSLNPARTRKIAICPRVTRSSGQYCVAEQPAVTPTSRSF